MSDTRQVQGLDRLVRANREVKPESVAPDPPAVEPAVKPVETPRRPAARTSPARKRPQPQTPANSPKQSITVSVPADVREQSRAAFRATQHLEADESYSDYVTKALAAENERRQRAHNGGEPFAGGVNKLPSGRPLGS